MERNSLQKRPGQVLWQFAPNTVKRPKRSARTIAEGDREPVSPDLDQVAEACL
jgi:hypothetical protein